MKKNDSFSKPDMADKTISKWQNISMESLKIKEIKNLKKRTRIFKKGRKGYPTTVRYLQKV